MASGLYIRLYTAALNDPKLCMVSDLAFRLYIRGLMIAKEHGDNGMFPVDALPIVSLFRDAISMAKARDELLCHGLWHMAKDGLAIGVPRGKWEDYQNAGTDAKSLRDKRSEAGRRGAEARWGDGKTDGKPDGKTDGKKFCHMANDGNREEMEKRRDGEETRTEHPEPAAQVLAGPEPATPDSVAAKSSVRRRSKDPINWTPEHGWRGIAADDRHAWATAYPACDLDRQLARMGEWLKANPAKARKSAWRRFVVNWLKREQDRGGDTPSNPTPNGKHKTAWVNPYPDDEPDFNAEANARARQEQNR